MSAIQKTLAELREDAARRNLAIDRAETYTVAELATRWKVSGHTVRDIPRDQLPYLELGQGLKLRRRRYRRVDVDAYETAQLRGRRA